MTLMTTVQRQAFELHCNFCDALPKGNCFFGVYGKGGGNKHLGAALLGAGPKNLVYVGGCLPSFTSHDLHPTSLSHAPYGWSIFFLLFYL